ncbi:protein YCF54, chloroplastic-like [Aristolochia californica]|uniref:protein YCF54, chloroplastic-like n=1 Tax=Aristolochia californica TaxID=171875 RepID=UPI0035D6C2BB
MVAPAALSLGSCAGLPAMQSERPFPSIVSPRKFISRSFGSRSKALFFSDKRSFSRFAAVTQAVAIDSEQLGSSDSSEQEKPKKYYFVVANAKFMLDEEEHFQELMFERLRNFEERNKEQDFWLVIEPKLLDKFPDITKRLKRPAVALVSTNGPWITFMKLRLDRVLAESFEAGNLEEALASNPTELKFETPEKWVAPYPKYEYGWWETFLPPGTGKEQA